VINDRLHEIKQVTYLLLNLVCSEICDLASWLLVLVDDTQLFSLIKIELIKESM
jgi:hypothetical protein